MYTRKRIGGKTHMKKIILGSLLALSIAVPALAHPPITVYVDQQEVVFADQAPVIVDDRTLVPMRKIFEAMMSHGINLPRPSLPPEAVTLSP